jgi:hypothetical protein
VCARAEVGNAHCQTHRTPTPAHAADAPSHSAAHTVEAGWRKDAYEPIVGLHNQERACKCVGELLVTLVRAVARSCLRPMMVLKSAN